MTIKIVANSHLHSTDQNEIGLIWDAKNKDRNNYTHSTLTLIMMEWRSPCIPFDTHTHACALVSC